MFKPCAKLELNTCIYYSESGPVAVTVRRNCSPQSAVPEEGFQQAQSLLCNQTTHSLHGLGKKKYNKATRQVDDNGGSWGTVMHARGPKVHNLWR
jgi:hypothetical protein